MTDRSTLSHLSFSLQELTNDHDEIDFLLSLYAELLLKLAGPYTSVPREIRIIRGDIAKLAKNPVFIPSRMERAYLTFDDIEMSMDLLKHRSICLFQDSDSPLERHPPLAMNCKTDIPTDYHRPLKSNTNFRGSSTTYHTASSGPLRPFQHLLSYHSTASCQRGGRSANHSDASTTPRDCVAPIALIFRFMRQSLPRYREM